MPHLLRLITWTLCISACSKQPLPTSDLSIADPQLLDKYNQVSQSTVALVTERGNFFSPYCSGVLIRPQWVVTAAHCLDGPVVSKLAFGLGTQNSPTLMAGTAIVHESYHQPYNEKFSFDIALIRLSQSAPSFMNPVTLASKHDFHKGDKVTLAGYGSMTDSRELNHVAENTGRLFATESQIKDIFTDRDTNQSDQDLFSYGLIEYSSPNHLSGACEGDSGGPMFITTTTNELKLIGIAVGGLNTPCDSSGWYTNLAFYGDWLNSHLF